MNESPHSVLVAEDNRVLSDVISFNLRRAGFDVTVARDGREAISKLQQMTFDLLLTDYQMPGATGEQLCQFVREVLQDADLPILICSAKGMELDPALMQDRWQIRGVIYKPFSMRDVIQRAVEATTECEVS